MSEAEAPAAETHLASLVRRAHEGEVLGEALFGRLLAAETTPERRQMMLASQLLERQTRFAMEGLASDVGVALDAADDQRRAGEQAAEALGAMDWTDRMAAIAAATGAYRTLYEELSAVLPDRDHPAMVGLLAHERALNAFAGAEAEGAAGSLAHLVSALDPDAQARLDAAVG